MEMVVFIFVIILLLKGRFGWAFFITFIFIFFPLFLCWWCLRFSWAYSYYGWRCCL